MRLEISKNLIKQIRLHVQSLNIIEIQAKQKLKLELKSIILARYTMFKVRISEYADEILIKDKKPS